MAGIDSGTALPGRAVQITLVLAAALVLGCGKDEARPDTGQALDAARLLHSTEQPATDDLTRGLAALQSGDADIAVRHLLATTAADPSSAVAFDGLSTAYGMLGDAANSLAAAESAVALDEDNPAYLSNRAQAYRRFGRDDDALRDLGRAIEVQPDFVAALFNRGSLRYQREDYAGALEDFSAAIEADPSAAPPHFNRAVTLEALGHLDAARRDLERFMELAADDNAKAMATGLLRQWSGRDGESGGSD